MVPSIGYGQRRRCNVNVHFRRNFKKPVKWVNLRGMLIGINYLGRIPGR